MSGLSVVAAPDAGVAAPPFYRWAFPGSPVRVRLKLDIVPGILEYLNEGFDADPKREAGGLLLGTIEPDHIAITGFERFIREHSNGTQFVISDGDKPRFLEALEGRAEKEGAARVVGYFRGHASDESLGLRKEDLTLIDTFFRKPSNVFMAVKPADEEACAAADFFFWDGGKVFAESIFPFPFDQRLLELEATAALLRASSPSPLPEEVPPRPDADDQPLAAVPGKLRQFWIPLAITGFLALALAIGGALFRPRSTISTPSPAAPRTVSLALSAKRAGTSLTIVWDAASQIAKTARVAMLSIEDGIVHKDLALTPPMLQAGTFVYQPAGKTVHVILEVFSPDGTYTRESISSSLNNPAVQEAISKAPGPRPYPDNTASEEKPRSQNNAVAAAQFEMPRTKVQTETPTLAPAPALETASRQAPVLPPTQLTAPTLNITPPPAAVEEPAAARPIAKAPDPKPIDPKPADTKPVDTARQTTSFLVTPPKPVRQIRPELPPNLRGILSHEVQVQVEVTIDESGKVVNATHLPTAGKFGEYLGKTAANAARLWRFEPARMNGKAMPGELVLEFRFVPDKKAW